MAYPGNPIQQGDNNNDVAAIQQQLNVMGFGDLTVDGDFGAQTLASVEAFQTANMLPTDGVVGEATWNALFVPPAPGASIAATALAVITSQLGIKEIPHGSNSGPTVNQYLASVGLGPGYAWCQSLVYWSYNQAARQLGVPNPVVHTAGVLDCWNKSTSKIDKVTAQGDPTLILPGYQMILDHGDGNGHTGLVEGVAGIALTTIEGNSNLNGSRDGEMVVRQTKRTLNDAELLGFIIY